MRYPPRVPRWLTIPSRRLYPNLGVVSAGPGRSFVMADIPGLIEGAAEGAGLGIRFLKHLQRTRVLLHLVDIAPPDPDADPVKDARSIIAELKKFAADLAAKERWLVINKIDLLEPQEAKRRAADIVRRLRWKGPVCLISGATGAGTAELKQAVMTYLEAHPREPAPADGGAGKRLSLLGERANLLGQAALVTSSLIAVNDALVDHAVDDRRRRGERCSRVGLIAGLEREGGLTDGAAQLRGQGIVAGAMRGRLSGSFFSRFRIRQAGTPTGISRRTGPEKSRVFSGSSPWLSNTAGRVGWFAYNLRL